MSAIVVGYDGTEGARVALDQATALAKAHGIGVHIVFVYDRVVIGGENRDLDQVVNERAQTVLAEGLAHALESQVPADTEFVEGTPAQALVDAADRLDAPYIVVGSYGERPLKGALVGATPHKLLWLSDRPVVVVRLSDDD